MSAYDRETQIEDLDAIAKAEGILSARVAGEHKMDLKPAMDKFARIAGYFAPDNARVKTVARMFWTLCTHKSIDGFQCQQYASLLPQVRNLVKAKLIRRQRKPKSCLKPNEHPQPCACFNLARAKLKGEQE